MPDPPSPSGADVLYGRPLDGFNNRGINLRDVGTRGRGLRQMWTLLLRFACKREFLHQRRKTLQKSHRYSIFQILKGCGQNPARQYPARIITIGSPEKKVISGSLNSSTELLSGYVENGLCLRWVKSGRGFVRTPTNTYRYSM